MGKSNDASNWQCHSLRKALSCDEASVKRVLQAIGAKRWVTEWPKSLKVRGLGCCSLQITASGKRGETARRGDGHGVPWPPPLGRLSALAVVEGIAPAPLPNKPGMCKKTKG